MLPIRNLRSLCFPSTLLTSLSWQETSHRCANPLCIFLKSIDISCLLSGHAHLLVGSQGPDAELLITSKVPNQNIDMFCCTCTITTLCCKLQPSNDIHTFLQKITVHQIHSLAFKQCASQILAALFSKCLNLPCLKVEKTARVEICQSHLGTPRFSSIDLESWSSNFQAPYTSYTTVFIIYTYILIFIYNRIHMSLSLSIHTIYIFNIFYTFSSHVESFSYHAIPSIPAAKPPFLIADVIRMIL